MDISGLGNSSVHGTSVESVARQIDLSESPLPSPRQTDSRNGAGGGDAAEDRRCGPCGEAEGRMVVGGVEFVRGVNVGRSEARENGREWKCEDCSTKCGRGKMLSAADGGDGLGLLDINASPPPEDEGGETGFMVNSELAVAISFPKMQDTRSNPVPGFTLSSPTTHADATHVATGYPSTSASINIMQIALSDLEIATQKASFVYLEALKDYISKRRGVLGDGWRVKFEYLESSCKTAPIYCAPDGITFHSMPEVASHLGLPSACTNDKGSSIPLLQNGSPRAKHDNILPSRVINGQNAVEVNPSVNGGYGSQSFLDGFPVQYEDFFVTSVGKINPRFPFHNTCQIWPVGYRSVWHDRLTGSIFVCNVLDGGDGCCGPIFRIHRYPCTKQSIPNASTVLCQRKCPIDEKDPTANDDFSGNGMLKDEHTNTRTMPSDVIGELLVDGRSPSSAWQLMLEMLIHACDQAFKDLRVVTFCCNHCVSGQHHSGSYDFSALYKFSCSAGPINIVRNTILTRNELEVTCLLLRKWLQLDRFGFDADFVQELIEHLPGVTDCLLYKPLRCRNSMAQTVGNGFFMVLRKYNSQPIHTQPRPPGNTIPSIVPPHLIGDVLQVYEFSLCFHEVLGQDTPLSRQKLELELMNPLVDGLKPLANFHMGLLKVLLDDILSKVTEVFDPFGAVVCKARKVRKKDTDLFVCSKNTKLSTFPLNEITWPELARRYILAVLSMDGNLESSEAMKQGCGKVWRCLNGDGGSLTGVAAMEADAVALAEAAKRIFRSINSEITNFTIDEEILRRGDSARERHETEIEIPDWITILEPVRTLPTNVGAKIRNRVRESLEKNPPAWAKEKLSHSISKEVYKGNAAGPTKKIVCSILDKARHENVLMKKKAKESRVVRTLHDAIIRRCRLVLRSVAADDKDRAFFTIVADSLQKADESCDSVYAATVFRQLDFRTVDLRLDAGFYGASHESFMEDVHEVWQNLRVTYRNKPERLDSIETLSKKLEELYKQQVLSLVSKAVDFTNGSTSPFNVAKQALNTMLVDTIVTKLIVAPWEHLVCIVCGMDKDDKVVLLCDRCDSEYHTYCLDPPLPEVPEGDWYCPSCVPFLASQTTSQAVSCGPDKEEMHKHLVPLAALANKIELREYWELGIEERVLLLKFLSDETLSSNILRNHICPDQDSEENLKNNIRRVFLGRDSLERLYWVLGHPERIVVSNAHSEGELCVTSGHSSWACYESDSEIDALIGSLTDHDARVQELRETIIQWQKNRSNGQNDDKCQTDGQDVHGSGKKDKNDLLVDRASEIIRFLKGKILDIEAAIPVQARRPRVDADKIRVWRAFIKSAESIHEMVQAIIVLEDMIKTEYLRRTWWYSSSPSSANKMSTLSSVGLRIFALDAAILYE